MVNVTGRVAELSRVEFWPSRETVTVPRLSPLDNVAATPLMTVWRAITVVVALDAVRPVLVALTVYTPAGIRGNVLRLKVATPLTALALAVMGELLPVTVMETDAVDSVTTWPLLLSIDTVTVPRFPPASRLAGMLESAVFVGAA
jgi:hypothetical protein